MTVTHPAGCGNANNGSIQVDNGWMLQCNWRICWQYRRLLLMFLSYGLKVGGGIHLSNQQRHL